MSASEAPKIDVLVDVKPLLGEGPIWDADSQRLYFIDALGRRIFRCTEDGAELRAWTVPSRIGSMALRAGGGAVVALANGFYSFDFDGGEVQLIVNPEPGEDSNAFNDGKVDPGGRFLCGSMDMGEEAASGALWRLEPDMSVTKLDEGIICSNGPCWSPDGRRLYFADSFKNTIYVYDYDPATGAARNRRDFVRVDESRGGGPDGATVDAEGFVWSATVFDGRIFRYAPDGSVDRVVEMPVCKITSLAFGGPDLNRLYVTSMAEPPLAKYPDDGPLRGSTFVVTGLGVRGLPEPKFAG